jgi:peptide/nickel transport system permease protein
MVKRLGGAGTVAAIVLATIVLAAVAAAAGLAGDGWRELSAWPHRAPDGEHWLGTDVLGRDVAARVLQGARVSLAAGLGAALATTAIGAASGTLAGLRGGGVDRLLVALADALASVPALIAIVGLGLCLGPGLPTVIAAIALTQWVSVFRAVRVEAARLRRADFVRAAEAMGASWVHQLRVHVVPNLAPLLTTSFGLAFVWAVQAEAVLGWLGLSSADLPSWGRIMAEGTSELARGIWWPVVGAAAPLAALVLAVQAIADRLSAADPP